MIGRILAGLVVALLAGCGSTEPPAAPALEGQDASAMPPAEMRTILEGLTSDHPDVQYGALETLGRFPGLVQAHRERVERLKREGKNERVRRKAAELLASLEK